MQLVYLSLLLWQMSFTIAQTLADWASFVNQTSGPGAKTADYCRKQANCVLTVQRLEACNDTKLDQTSLHDALGFQGCICETSGPRTYNPFISTWTACLQCWIDNFAFGQDAVTNAQYAMDTFCHLSHPNVSWFDDLNWIVLIAGFPSWATWRRPSATTSMASLVPTGHSAHSYNSSIGLDTATKPITTNISSLDRAYNQTSNGSYAVSTVYVTPSTSTSANATIVTSISTSEPASASPTASSTSAVTGSAAQHRLVSHAWATSLYLVLFMIQIAAVVGTVWA